MTLIGIHFVQIYKYCNKNSDIDGMYVVYINTITIDFERDVLSPLINLYNNVAISIVIFHRNVFCLYMLILFILILPVFVTSY